MTGAAHDPGISAKLRYTTSTDMTVSSRGRGVAGGRERRA